MKQFNRCELLLPRLTKTMTGAFEASALAGYRIAEVGSIYGGIRQRWLVVESGQRQGSGLKALEKRLDKATQRIPTQLDQLSRQLFACQADAQQVIEQFEKTLKQPHVTTQIEIVEKPHYDTAGRSAKTARPSAIYYHIQATLTLEPAAVERQQRRAGRFILATNVLAGPIV